MSQVHLTDRALARIVKTVAEAARKNPATSQAALLNIATCEIAGPGHDWGLIRNAAAPVTSRDIPAEPVATPALPANGMPAAREIPEDQVAGYLYEAKIRFVSQSGDLGDLDLDDVAYEVDAGEAIGGPLKIERTPLDRKTRNAIAREFGSDPSFFGEEEDLERFQMVVEVSCLVDFEDLDSEDVDADGNCIVDGMYALTVIAPEGTREEIVIELAKDLFHGSVPIACLDDFDIVTRRRTRSDADGDFQLDLGSITATDERLEQLAEDLREESGPGL